MELSKMFKVERDTDFEVEGYVPMFKVILDGRNVECLMFRWTGISEWQMVDSRTLCDIIRAAPAGIIHLPPPLTDEQRVVLMSLFTMGARYMGMTPDGWKRCFVNKPKKEANTWIFGEIADMQMLSIAPKMANCLDTLINLSDPEPFDIGKALGFGVEEEKK